jgi:hypothetical protein
VFYGNIYFIRVLRSVSSDTLSCVPRSACARHKLGYVTP